MYIVVNEYFLNQDKRGRLHLYNITLMSDYDNAEFKIQTSEEGGRPKTMNIIN